MSEAIMYGDVTVWFENVTPQMAESLLANNYDRNRKLRKNYVDQLAAIMREGRFDSLNGQTILVDERWRLFNGQHRLTALARAGVTLPFIIVRSKHARESYKTIDTGTKRKVSDMLVGEPNATTLGAVGKAVACFDWGDAPFASAINGRVNTKEYMDQALICDYINQHTEQLEQIVRKALRMSHHVSIPATWCGVFIWLARNCAEVDLVDEFIEECCMSAPNSKTVTAFKMHTLKLMSGSTKVTNKPMLVGMLLNGYERFIKMDDSTASFNKTQQWVNKYAERLEAYRSEKRMGEVA